MRKLVLKMSAGPGTDTCVAYLVPEDVSQDELDNFAWLEAVEHASMFGIYPESDMPEDWDEDDGDSRGEEYSSDIEGYWEEYDADKHDGHLIFGCNSDFKWNQY